jgi:hypothetical protein
LKDLPTEAELHEQFFHAWRNWMNWVSFNPQKRRALVQLGISDEITSESRATGHKIMAPVAGLLGRCRASGPMQKAPMEFVVAVMNSVAEATMDFMIQDPANAKKHSKEGFDALWRMLR